MKLQAEANKTVIPCARNVCSTKKNGIYLITSAPRIAKATSGTATKIQCGWVLKMTFSSGKIKKAGEMYVGLDFILRPDLTIFLNSNFLIFFIECD